MQRLVALLLPILLMTGCASLDRSLAPALDEKQGLSTRYLGIPNARFFPDSQPDFIRANWIATERLRASNFGTSAPLHMLALSGGGGNGAFGAGLLYGWSERGTRPRFDFVTGVSTGALMAPFAFLGPDYDTPLRRLYTSLSDDDVAQMRPWLSVLRSDSLADSSPLAKRIERELTPEIIEAIARESRKGRVLLVGTTNLDLARPVIWNIGAIAASGSAEARPLIARILLASASIPGLFPPVLFPLHEGEDDRQEMHVDGGVSNQLFLYSSAIPLASAPPDIRKPRRTSWIIRNGRFHEPIQETERGLIPIATRSISALIAANALGDTYRTYLAARRDGIAYNLAVIPETFRQEPKSAFDPDYMTALFEHGRAHGRSGRPWLKSPPGFVP